MKTGRLATRLFGTGNVLVVHRFTLDLVNGDHLAALFLEQLVYWTQHTNNPDGWIVKTYAEWESELRLSKYLVGRIADSLASIGVETTVRRSPFHNMQPVVHYRVNLATLEVKISEIIESEEISLSNESQEFSPSITETTTEPNQSVVSGNLPDFVTPLQRKIVALPPPQPDGGAKVYALIEAWLDAWDIMVPRYRKAAHKAQIRGAAYLAEMDATPEDITAFVQEKRAKGKNPDEWPMTFIANNFVGWKSRAVATAQPASFWGRDLTDGE